jgi:hypothetical protein
MWEYGTDICHLQQVVSLQKRLLLQQLNWVKESEKLIGFILSCNIVFKKCWCYCYFFGYEENPHWLWVEQTALCDQHPKIQHKSGHSQCISSLSNKMQHNWNNTQKSQNEIITDVWCSISFQLIEMIVTCWYNNRLFLWHAQVGEYKY